MMAQPKADTEAKDNDKDEYEMKGDLSRAEKIRGNYENKIRFFSPPEKVFEIFAH